MKIVFFGSTGDSVIVVGKLAGVVAVVTQPPKPTGRKRVITETPVARWAREHNVPVTTLDAVSPFKPDILISASYGEKIPVALIKEAKYGGLNVHPSLLPRWRGGDPVPWAILADDHQIGVTVSTLSEKFDEGKIIAQKKIPVSPHAESDPLRTKLFTIGAELLSSVLPDYVAGSIKGKSQDPTRTTYARRLTREDGFVPWELLGAAMHGRDVVDRPPILSLNKSHIAITIAGALRALSPWPGIWTLVNGKRLKILSCHVTEVTNNLVLDAVQLEGKKPVPWEQFQEAYLSS